MGDYGVAVSAILGLVVIGLTQYWFRTRRGRPAPAPWAGPAVSNQLLESAGPYGDFAEQVLEFPPHGQVLMLTAPERPKPNAIWEKLGPYCDGHMPFVGIIVDCGGREYHFSSADLGGMASAIAAWVRGWVAPCAVVVGGSGADELRHMLRITKLGEIEELRIVGSVELARAHVESHLRRRAV